MEPELDASSVPPASHDGSLPAPRAASACPAPDAWTNGVPGKALHAAQGVRSVWTGTLMLLWGRGELAGSNPGFRYDPLLDDWTPMSVLGAPTQGNDVKAVRGANRLIVWGGGVPGTPVRTRDGGRYDPVADVWSPITTTGAPGGTRLSHSAVWTGTATDDRVGGANAPSPVRTPTPARDLRPRRRLVDADLDRPIAPPSRRHSPFCGLDEARR